MCIKFESEEISTTGDDCSKSHSKEEEVRSFALRADEALDCQQGEAKCGFVTVVIGIIIIFVWKSRCFYTCFCIACYCFSCNNLCCDAVHELPLVWRLCSAFSTRFLRGGGGAAGY